LLFRSHRGQRIRRNQHLPAREPVSRVCDQIANGPVPVIEVEFFNFPDRFPVLPQLKMDFSAIWVST
jgi:hypothetical protein